MFNSIQESLKDLQEGKMIIVMDDEGRENEGDILMAAQFVTPEKINFMAKYARGLICVPMEEEQLNRLELHPMKDDRLNTYRHQSSNTGWAISVDAAKGITTGISAFDRSQTVKVLIDPKSQPSDLETPGHLFPLRARNGGVLVRAGHTEASVDLMRLAGLYPAGVICEIMNADGSMARRPQLEAIAERFDLKIVSVAQLIDYRRQREKLVRRLSTAILPTRHGEFNAIAYEDVINHDQHVA